MLHELYEDMDPEFKSRVFLARKILLGSVESPTLIPAHGMTARNLLTPSQLEKVKKIRTRRLSRVINQFTPD